MTRLWRFLTAALLAAAAATAGAAEAPEVTAQEVKKMMDEGGVLVINPLSPIEFNDLHIAGSVNIPLSRLESGLPADKATKLVFYCLGRK